ncbi:MAG: zinc-dependent metalloprotease [Acidobacteria bacterium]|nr:zinc-dependent metalloprotease [Acidobacteriota bacterium]
MRELTRGIIVMLVSCNLVFGAQAPAPKESQKSEAAAPFKPEQTDETKKAEPPKDKPFAEIVKDAQEIKGLFTLHRTEEKVYLEILPDQLEQTYLLSLTTDSGIGERGFFAADMTAQAPIVFHKLGKNIQVRLRNTRFTAEPDTPIERAVSRSFSDSVLGIAKIESLPHPDRKSVLIDLGTILLSDLPMLGYGLEATFRISYRFDPKNSVFGAVKAFPRNVELETVAHYATDRPPLPPLLPPGAPVPALPAPPRNLPDVRSMIFHFRYSLSGLPDSGYRPRLADDRVGHFFDQVEDYTDDRTYSTSKRYINRWRLEKQDPSSALSRPKQPIVFWLENTIPVEYRNSVREGILMWNKAFERIGFRDAIEVKQQPDDADWDSADVRYNTIRWFAGYPDPGFAQGPSRTNPMTGEIYDADIRFAESMTRFMRREASEQIAPVAAAWENSTPSPFVSPWSRNRVFAACDYAQGAVLEAAFVSDLLLARGMDPQGPEAESFIKEFLREIAAHEVGHTLGLRHNFRASTIHTFEQLQDTAITARDGLTGSVMDYIPTNIAAKGEKQGEYHQTTLGPYDYWAIA